MFRELTDTMGRAGADAALAEETYRDGGFRQELRTLPELALARFELSAPDRMAPVREMPAAWRFRGASRRRAA